MLSELDRIRLFNFDLKWTYDASQAETLDRQRTYGFLPSVHGHTVLNNIAIVPHTLLNRADLIVADFLPIKLSVKRYGQCAVV